MVTLYRAGLKRGSKVARIICLALPGCCLAKQVHFLAYLSIYTRPKMSPEDYWPCNHFEHISDDQIRDLQCMDLAYLNKTRALSVCRMRFEASLFSTMNTKLLLLFRRSSHQRVAGRGARFRPHPLQFRLGLDGPPHGRRLRPPQPLVLRPQRRDFTLHLGCNSIQGYILEEHHKNHHENYECNMS